MSTFLFRTLVVNDTIRLQHLSKLSGSFTVGSETADYETLNSAISDLETRGICGPVVLNLLSGTYDEKVLVPEIRGTSIANTIIIQSLEQNRDAVTFSASHSNNENYFIKLSGASFVTVQHLTFDVRSSNSYTTAINISGDGTDITLRDLNLSARYHLTGTTHNASLVFVDQIYATNLLIEDCTFGQGKFHLTLDGGGDRYLAENIRIQNNIFEGSATVSLTIDDLNDVKFHNNLITGSRTTAAIQMDETYGGIEITNNIINTTGYRGIECDNIFDSHGSTLLIYNNFLTTHSTAIDISSFSHVKVLHNNINNKSSSTAITISSSSNYADSLEFINNIVNLHGTNRLYALSGPDTETYHYIFSNNALHTLLEEDLSLYYFSESITLKDWQEIHGYESNSIVTDPKFISDDDLHLDNTIAINGKGLPNVGITTDIDGEKRDVSTPDIGADEIYINPSLVQDIGIESIGNPNIDNCSLASSLDITIKNHTQNRIDSFYVEYEIFGIKHPPIKVERVIEPNETVVHKVIDYQFNTNTLYDLKIRVSQPNGQTDDVQNNNSIDYVYYQLIDVEIYQEIKKCDDTVDLYIDAPYNSTIEWSTGESEHRLTNVPPGDYSIIVTTPNGCEVSNSIKIEE